MDCVTKLHAKPRTPTRTKATCQFLSNVKSPEAKRLGIRIPDIEGFYGYIYAQLSKTV